MVLAELHVTSQHIRATGGTQQLRGTMMASALYRRCLHWWECQDFTRRQTQQMRRTLCTAMGDEHGRRSYGLRLLVERTGAWAPEIV